MCLSTKNEPYLKMWFSCDSFSFPSCREGVLWSLIVWQTIGIKAVFCLPAAVNPIKVKFTKVKFCCFEETSQLVQNSVFYEESAYISTVADWRQTRCNRQQY